MNLSRWMLVYLVTGSTFTRRAMLAFYGGGLVILGVAVVIAVILLTEMLKSIENVLKSRPA